MHPLRVYVDTSVFGATGDEGVSESSRSFFKRAADGEFVILVSQVTVDELDPAPLAVRAVLDQLPDDAVRRVDVDDEVRSLAAAYLAAGVVSERYEDDALHVAAATVARADIIISWNFRHMVNINRIRAFGAVNLANGYALTDIRSPLEVGNVDDD